jgi:hypothetical protein
MKTITNDPIIIYTIRIPVLDMLVLNGKKIASMIWAKKQIKKAGTVKPGRSMALSNSTMGVKKSHSSSRVNTGMMQVTTRLNTTNMVALTR